MFSDESYALPRHATTVTMYFNQENALGNTNNDKRFMLKANSKDLMMEFYAI